MGTSNKILVGLYLNNGEINSVDLSHPEKGNPGIGGSEFNCITLAYYFNRLRSDSEFKMVIYANSIAYLPPSVDCHEVKTAFSAMEQAAADGCHMFIYRPTEQDYKQGFLLALEKTHLKGIIRAHNTPPWVMLDDFAQSSAVHRLVSVGEERLDLLRGHPIFEKSTLIFNGFDASPYIPNPHIVGRGNKVVYMGSLIKAKGFHVLAQIWPRILHAIPNAELLVIGSGKLYNRETQLGKWGVAEESYEKMFRSYLSDRQGNPMSSVKFLGLMGIEKIPIIQQADIGIVNPTGKTEVCPATALEFQACGTPVVSIAEWGLLDTVLNRKTGLLGKREDELASNIIKLLRNAALREKFGEAGISFVQDKFDHNKITQEWEQLLFEVYNNIPNRPLPVRKNLFYRKKYLRELLRLSRKNIPFMRRILANSRIRK
jgi:glycosyltransferase involved in cell wall biosynthesis